MFNYDKLRGRIREKLGSEAKFAEVIGISAASLSYTFSGKRDFSTTEIQIACRKDVLDIPKRRIAEFFLNENLN